MDPCDRLQPLCPLGLFLGFCEYSSNMQNEKVWVNKILSWIQNVFLILHWFLPHFSSHHLLSKWLKKAINQFLWLQSLQCCQRDDFTYGAEPLRGSLMAVKIPKMEKVVPSTSFWPPGFKPTTPPNACPKIYHTVLYIFASHISIVRNLQSEQEIASKSSCSSST